MQNKIIKSNAHGSFIQEIIIKVDLTVSDTARQDLDYDAFKSDEHHAYFTVFRYDRKRGDDESIVHDLSDLFSFDKNYWSIDWNNSIY